MQSHPYTDVLEAGLLAEPKSEAGRELLALLERLRGDRSHAGWKLLLAVLARRLVAPLARKFPGVTDADDALSTLSAMMTVGTEKARPWLADYVELTSGGGQTQPFGRFLERRLRDVLRERVETARRRQSEPVPLASWEPPPPPDERLEHGLRDAARIAIDARRKGSSETREGTDEDERLASLRGAAMLILRESGFTQTEIAATMHTSVASVNRWFKHVESVHAEQMARPAVAGAASNDRRAQHDRRVELQVAAAAGGAVVAAIAALAVVIVVVTSYDGPQTPVASTGPVATEETANTNPRGTTAAGSGSELALDGGDIDDRVDAALSGSDMAPSVPGSEGRSVDDLLDDALSGSDMAPSVPGNEGRPVTPSRGDVASAINSVSSAVSSCGAGEHGTANVRIVFSGGTGRVTNATVAGGSFSPPVTSCIARAARRARVPTFQQPTFSVNHPFHL